MILVNPYTGKPVNVADAHVDRLVRAGFKKQEPEVVRPKEGAPADKPIQRRPRRK